MKVAIFLDYIGAIGGGERVALMLARALQADIITTDVSQEAVQRLGYGDVRIRSLGKTVKLPPFKQISASFLFAKCDFSQRIRFFYFLGKLVALRSQKTSSQPLVLLHAGEGLLRSERVHDLQAAQCGHESSGGFVDKNP